MRYCTRCITPDTRPQVVLDGEGVCSACRNHGTRAAIDWPARAAAFRDVVRNAQARSKGHDCVIPVSGGKDSTWQVVTCLEHGLNPLCVTWKAPSRTAIGAANLANLVSLGVDHIDYQVNPKTERKFLRLAFERNGATGIPMHMALFNIPAAVAVRFGIPLVVWGENSAFEYGGTGDERLGFRMDRAWREKFGVTHGTTAADWVGETLSAREMTPYFGPSDEEMEEKRILAVFLGYYFPWDPETTLSVAARHGFKTRAEGPLTGYYDYADIDDDFIAIHHFLKWHKFGFTRIFDNLSLEIRNGRMTRDEAIEAIRRRGDETPHREIGIFCDFVGMTKERFFGVCETFRNPAIWRKEGERWVMPDFLVPDWNWS